MFMVFKMNMQNERPIHYKSAFRTRLSQTLGGTYMLEPEQIKRGSTGSMLQEHFMISGTFESETHTNKQPDLIINKIYEYH